MRVREQRDIGAGERGIADIAEFFVGQIGQQADLDGVFHLDIAPEPAGDVDAAMASQSRPTLSSMSEQAA